MRRRPARDRFCALLLAVLICFPYASKAEEVAFAVQDVLTAKTTRLPYTVYLRFRDITETRMGLDVFADLRSIQDAAPLLLSQVVDETCKRKLAVAISEVTAQDQSISVRGQFQAKFYACDTSDPAVHYRGVLLFGQNVNFFATARADARRSCVSARLVNVDLDALGFVGATAELFGLIDLAERVIIEQAEDILSQNPVCPKLPPELSSLEPRLTAGSIEEIGDGGVGAGLSGSVDTSAGTILDLVRLMRDRGVLETGQ